MKIHPARQLGQRGVRLADQQFPELVLPPRREAALAPLRWVGGTNVPRSRNGWRMRRTAATQYPNAAAISRVALPCSYR